MARPWSVLSQPLDSTTVDLRAAELAQQGQSHGLTRGESYVGRHGQSTYCEEGIETSYQTNNFTPSRTFNPESMSEFWTADAAKETLLSLPEYQSAKRISVYLSMPKGELSTRSIVTAALQQGKEVYVPYIHKTTPPAEKESSASVMDLVSLHSQEDFEALQPDPWGIPTPGENSISDRRCCLGQQRFALANDEVSGLQSGKLELVIMPGVAFDPHLNRLGHGKGYYDRFLSQYQRLLENNPDAENQMPFLVALALEEQVLSEGHEVPTNASDWRVNALIAGHQPIRRH
ncbi:MAG: hypothetical protein Q9169_003192 [Polycauliona sp. 2 TL-2023]